jgi:hypothetical protein
MQALISRTVSSETRAIQGDMAGSGRDATAYAS